MPEGIEADISGQRESGSPQQATRRRAADAVSHVARGRRGFVSAGRMRVAGNVGSNPDAGRLCAGTSSAVRALPNAASRALLDGAENRSTAPAVERGIGPRSLTRSSATARNRHQLRPVTKWPQTATRPVLPGFSRTSGPRPAKREARARVVLAFSLLVIRKSRGPERNHVIPDNAFRPAQPQVGMNAT